MAFSNALRVRMSVGCRSRARSRRAGRSGRRSGRALVRKGIAAQPGSDMPSAPASAFMVEAVPMVLHVRPTAPRTRPSRRPGFTDAPPPTPGARSATAMPEPERSPFHQPFSIGPPESTIAGWATVAAAIRQAGVNLSQPVISTTPRADSRRAPRPGRDRQGSVERRGRPLAGFLDRMYREFERDAAGGAMPSRTRLAT